MQAFFVNFLLAPAFEIPQTPKWRCSYAAARPAPGRESPGNVMVRTDSQTADRVWPRSLQRIADPQRKGIPGSRLPCRGAP
jgi:hypothetical protein